MGSWPAVSGCTNSRQTIPVPGCRTSDRNSARVSFCRKQPTIALVTVDEILLLDAAHHHAQVPRLNHDAHALRRDRFLNCSRQFAA